MTEDEYQVAPCATLSVQTVYLITTWCWLGELITPLASLSISISYLNASTNVVQLCFITNPTRLEYFIIPKMFEVQSRSLKLLLRPSLLRCKCLIIQKVHGFPINEYQSKISSDSSVNFFLILIHGSQTRLKTQGGDLYDQFLQNHTSSLPNSNILAREAILYSVL